MQFSEQHLPWSSESAIHEPRINVFGDDQVFTPLRETAIAPWPPPFGEPLLDVQARDLYLYGLPNPLMESNEKTASMTDGRLPRSTQLRSFMDRESSLLDQGTTESHLPQEFSECPSQLLLGISGHAEPSVGLPDRRSLAVRRNNDNASVSSSHTVDQPKPRKKSGGRKGTMEPEKARKTHEIRIIGSCFHCWTRKVEVRGNQLRKSMR